MPPGGTEGLELLKLPSAGAPGALWPPQAIADNRRGSQGTDAVMLSYALPHRATLWRWQALVDSVPARFVHRTVVMLPL